MREQFAAIGRLGDPIVTQGFLASAPDDGKPATNLLRANLLRRAGRIEEARACFAAVPGLELPDGNISPVYACNQNRFRICPVVMIDDFLPMNRARALHRQACDLEPKFTPANVGMNADMKEEQYMPGWRKTLATRSFSLEHQFMLDYVETHLAGLQRSLGLPAFAKGTSDIKMTCHIDGGFFRLHADNHAAIAEAGRALSWLYYFGADPPRHEGGELVLFDTDIDADVGSQVWFTKIAPKPNRFIAFPSWFYHAVLPTRTLDGQFSSGRFALAGHVHKGADRSKWPDR